MSCGCTSNEIWWARILDRIDETVHNYPKLPKKPLAVSSLPYQIGSNITIKNYNTILNNYGSEGYKFYFELNADNKTGSVYIIGMATQVHEVVVNLLQKFFEVPNRGVIYDPPILVTGQPPPDVFAYPNTELVPRPVNSIIVPRPPSDVDGNSHARIVCEVAVSQNVGRLKERCLTWMCQQYVRAVISIKILDPRAGIREPGTGYFYRTMMEWKNKNGDFGNVIKNLRDPINEPAPCNAPNLPNFQINIPIGEVFWDPTFPIPPRYAPVIPPAITVNNFTIDLYWIQQAALDSKM
ncbi:16530_t:CDS:2 [Entrophospora sp. SA101]|nr:14453_t:CDS:2 [Entrophospora sp. SA101]CAJ0626512.1 16530_t:CDS:2 [Entrophospora sp. SA101]